MNDEKVDKLTRLIEQLLKEMPNMTAATDSAELKKEWFRHVLSIMEKQSKEIDALKARVSLLEGTKKKK